MAWLAGIFGRVGGTVLPVVAGLGAVAAILFGAKRAGQTEARADALQKDLENRDARTAVEAGVARQPDPARELQSRWGQRDL